MKLDILNFEFCAKF